MPSESQKQYTLLRGAPLPETFPSEFQNGQEIGETFASLISNDKDLLGYRGPDFMGYGPLREFLAQKHGVESDQIIMGHGGMDVTSHWLTFLNKQRADAHQKKEAVLSRRVSVAVEAPTYDRMLQNIYHNNMEAVGILMTPEGLDLECLEDLARSGSIDGFYGIPIGQNPSSYNYSPEQREAVEEICAKYDVFVLWDLAYQNLTYGWDAEEFTNPKDHVVAQLNFTKEISPGLKCGYLVLPKVLVEQMKEVVSSARLNAIHPVHALYHRFLETSRYPEHIQSLKELFSQRITGFLNTLEEHTPTAIYNSDLSSGYFIQPRFPGIQDHDKFMKALQTRGVQIGDARNTYPEGHKHVGVGEIRFAPAILMPEERDAVLQIINEVHQNLAL